MQFLKNIGTTELIVIGIILILLFGGKKLSEWARGLGETGKEIKKIKHDFKSIEEDEPSPKSTKSEYRREVE